MLFGYLPDVSILWRDVWTGAFATALMFTSGKAAIGYYLGLGTVGSAYGAAGSLVVLLVWVYYSSLILFMGAEITQAHANAQGREIRPDQYAVKVRRESVVVEATPPPRREVQAGSGGEDRAPGRSPPPRGATPLTRLSFAFAGVSLRAIASLDKSQPMERRHSCLLSR